MGERTVRIREVRGFDPLQVHQNKKAPDRVLFCFGLSPGDRTGAVVNDVPGARQSRDPASAAAEVDPLQVHQKRDSTHRVLSLFWCLEDDRIMSAHASLRVHETVRTLSNTLIGAADANDHPSSPSVQSRDGGLRRSGG